MQKHWDVDVHMSSEKHTWAFSTEIAQKVMGAN